MMLTRKGPCVACFAGALAALAALAPAAPSEAPGKERGAAGTLVQKDAATPSLLVYLEAGGKTYQWVAPDSKVFTADELISLPGSRSELRLDSGVHLVLRGMTHEFSRDPVTDYLLESAVVLHKDPDFDLDLTLERGRIYLSNHKDAGPAKVRLHFGPASAPQTWEVTLSDPGSEVGVDLSKHYARDTKYQEGEEPRMNLALQVLNGKAGVKAGAVSYPRLNAPPGRSLFTWDNKTDRTSGPQDVQQKMPLWSETPPNNRAANEMQKAVGELSARVDPKKSPVTAVEEALGGERPAERALAVYCLGALDEVSRLLAVLGDNDPKHAAEREKAVFTLRRWISRSAGQSKILYDPAKKAGLLTEKYRPGEAQIIIPLLHGFDETARQSPETYELLAQYLLSDKVAVAELAYYHLRRLAAGVRLPAFNAAWPRNQRQAVADAVLNLVKEGKLPPS